MNSPDVVLIVLFTRADKPHGVLPDRLMQKVPLWQEIQVVVFWANCICHKDVISVR